MNKTVSFANALCKLNMGVAHRIKVTHPKNIIRMNFIEPKNLIYPTGYYWDKKHSIITNKKNVSWWKVRKYRVILRKRM